MSRPLSCAAAITAWAIITSIVTANAQTSSTPGLSVPAPPRSGGQAAATAMIHGRVFDGESGQPLPRARVVGDAFVASWATTTDDQGRYELKDLPAGRYSIVAFKAGYLTLAYGQTRPLEAGRGAPVAGWPVDLLEGQALDKVDISLPRGGVITGHVVDEYGDPVPDAQVSTLGFQYVQGRRRLVPSGPSAVTDDLGEYRLHGLNPGDYYVSATVRPYRVISPGDEEEPSYAVTYFPATAIPAEAKRVSIGIGGGLDNVNIAVIPVKTARILGTVVNSRGQPATSGGSVRAMERSAGSFGSSSGAPIRPDGTFVLTGLASGEYTVRAQSQSPSGSPPEVAIMTVTLAGTDVSGLQLMTIPPSMVSGSLIVDPAAAASIKASEFRLVVTPLDRQDMSFNQPGPVKDDFTFEAAVQPGVNLVRLFGTQNGWALKAVRVGGLDVTDSGFVVKPNEPVQGIEIEVTGHPTEVSGLVTDNGGTVAKDYIAVIFASDERKWDGASRYIRTSRPDHDGRFTVSGLPPGDYQIMAVDALEPGQENDPEFLNQNKGDASAFSLNEGETKVINLKQIAQAR
jgi:hypothetical protein